MSEAGKIGTRTELWQQDLSDLQFYGELTNRLAAEPDGTRITLPDLRKVWNDLNEGLPRELNQEASLTNGQRQQIKRKLGTLLQDFEKTGVPSDQTLTPEQAEILFRAGEALGRYHNFLVSQNLRRQKDSLVELGLDRRSTADLNKKMDRLFTMGRVFRGGPIAKLAGEIQAEIDHHALRLTVRQEIEAFQNGKETGRTAYRDSILTGLSFMPPRFYEDGLKILQEIEEKRAAGKEAEARAEFTEFASSPFHRDLVKYLEAAKDYVTVRRLTVGTAIVFASALTANAVAAVAAPLVEDSLLGPAAVQLAKGGTFFVTDRVLNAALPEGKLIRASGTADVAAEIGKGIVGNAGMFGVLDSTGEMTREALTGLAKSGAAGFATAKTLEEGAGFAALTAWETFEPNAHALLDGRLPFGQVADQVYSWDATRERALTLGALKVGHAVGEPLGREVAAWARNKSIAAVPAPVSGGSGATELGMRLARDFDTGPVREGLEARTRARGKPAMATLTEDEFVKVLADWIIEVGGKIDRNEPDAAAEVAAVRQAIEWASSKGLMELLPREASAAYERIMQVVSAEETIVDPEPAGAKAVSESKIAKIIGRRVTNERLKQVLEGQSPRRNKWDQIDDAETEPVLVGAFGQLSSAAEAGEDFNPAGKETAALRELISLIDEARAEGIPVPIKEAKYQKVVERLNPREFLSPEQKKFLEGIAHNQQEVPEAERKALSEALASHHPLLLLAALDRLKGIRVVDQRWGLGRETGETTHFRSAPLQQKGPFQEILSDLSLRIFDGIEEGTIQTMSREKLKETVDRVGGEPRRQILRKAVVHDHLDRRLREFGVPDPQDLEGSLLHLLDHPAYLLFDGPGDSRTVRTSEEYERLIRDVVRTMREELHVRGLGLLLLDYGRDINGDPIPFLNTRRLIDRLPGSVRSYYRPSDPVGMLKALIYDDQVIADLRSKDDLAPLYANAVRELAEKILQMKQEGKVSDQQLGTLPLRTIPERQLPQVLKRELGRILNRPGMEAKIQEMIQQWQDLDEEPELPRQTPTPGGEKATRYFVYDRVKQGGSTLHKVSRDTTVTLVRTEDGIQPDTRREFPQKSWLYADGGLHGETANAHVRGRFYFAVKAEHAAEFWNGLRKVFDRAEQGGHPFQAKISQISERFESGDPAVLYIHANDQEFFHEQVVAYCGEHPEWFHDDRRPVFAAQVRDESGRDVRGVSFAQASPRAGTSANSLRANVLTTGLRNLRLLSIIGMNPTPEQVTTLLADAIYQDSIDPEHPAFNHPTAEHAGGAETFRFILEQTDQGGPIR